MSSIENSTLLGDLNEEQKAAVGCIDGPVLIVAGAGSGKTRVLTARIGELLRGGCAPERVMALTFTKKAAGEMKERIALAVGRGLALRLCMGTFHSVFVRFLREFAPVIGYPQSFTIYDKGDTESAVKTCIRELGLDDKAYKPRDISSRISLAKNNLITAESYALNAEAVADDVRSKKPAFKDIFLRYCQRCKASGVMDFDDILLNMNILLRDSPDALRDIAGRFRYLLVDEYQDTNYAQYRILRSLASQHHNLCVVGDDSQSIYAFRGARIENILRFRKDFPEAKVFRLERNYRSTQNIVGAANSLIANNVNRIPKQCVSVGEAGEKLKFVSAYTELEEALLAASGIVSRMERERSEYQDFAILYRTNSQSRAIEEALRRRNLPYMVYSGRSFFDRAEVKDMMAYLKLAVNPNDDEAFRRVVNVPARGIGATSFAALCNAAHEHGTSLFRATSSEDLERFGLKGAAIAKLRSFSGFIDKAATKARSEDAFEVAGFLSDGSGLYSFYKTDNTIEAQSKAANIEELLNSIASFREQRHEAFVADRMAAMEGEGVREGSEPYVVDETSLPVVTLSEFLEETSLLSNADTSDGEDGNNKIALMTVHSAKGLEFPYVYIVGMEENLFPSGGLFASPAEIEEERRLFYVALTRAKKAVSISFCQTRMRNGKHEANAPSRFLREIDPQFVANPLAVCEEAPDDDLGSGFFGSRFGGSSRGFGSFGRFGGTGTYGRLGGSGTSGHVGGSDSSGSAPHGFGRFGRSDSSGRFSDSGHSGSGYGSSRRFGRSDSSGRSSDSGHSASGYGPSRRFGRSDSSGRFSDSGHSGSGYGSSGRFAGSGAYGSGPSAHGEASSRRSSSEPSGYGNGWRGGSDGRPSASTTVGGRQIPSAPSVRDVKAALRNRPLPPKTDDPNFIPEPPEAFRPGQRVEHNRFGLGTIQKVEGQAPDLKATVDFDAYGSKILLLRFAKMRFPKA